MEADLDKDGKISFEEFKKKVENTDVSMSMTLGRTCSPTTTGRTIRLLTSSRSILVAFIRYDIPRRHEKGDMDKFNKIKLETLRSAFSQAC